MAVSAPNIRATFATDAEFREWAQAIHDALIAVGMTQTADTGQINLATVAKPAAANTAQGYEIWRFSDTLQSTRPIYIKIEYGSSAGSATRGSLWFTTGTITNGAGTITGQGLTRSQASISADPTGQGCRFSGSTNRLVMSLYHGLAANLVFGIERTHDADGSDNNKGYTLFYFANNGRYFGVIPLPAGTAVGDTTGIPWSGALLPDTTSVDGADVVFYPALTPARYGRGPCKNLIVYAVADVSTDGEIVIDPYGGSSTITYRAPGPGPGNYPNANWRMALRYD